MASSFDITEHPLLTMRALQSSYDEPVVFDANVEMAELIHNLTPAKYKEPELIELAKLVLIHQVNYQYENDGNLDIYDSVKEGETTYDYRQSYGVSKTATYIRKKIEETLKVLMVYSGRSTVNVTGSVKW